MNLKYSINLNNKRWALDEPEDFKFIKIIYKKLYFDDSLFVMKKMLYFLKRYPKMEEINKNIIRDERY